ncbi:MAG: excinuclease ABC subunit C [Bacteroidetes bacterium]|nr:excinuclease ABC subunit C [Bacteroidota bacterium]
MSEESNELQPNYELPTVELAAKVANLPTKPGIYQFKNENNTIIYIGKAKSLRNRVRSYFQNRPMDAKTKALITKIVDVEVIVTDSEVEALILENNLIKQFKPRYNILLKDDRTYPYIRITNEEYPRIFSTRTVIRDGSKYFGPYTDNRYLYYLLKTLRTIFPLRSCELPLTDSTIAEHKYKVCLDYHIKKCEGPCEGFVNRAYYNEYISQSIKILNGRTKEVEILLEAKMEELAEQLKFEEAAALRNRLLHLKEYTAKQKVMTTDLVDRDVFALSRDDDDACAVIFVIRDGKMIGKRHFYISNSIAQTDEHIIQHIVEKWYMETDFIPEEIVISHEPEQQEFLNDILVKKRGGVVTITIPKVGDKKKLIVMAITNADFLLRELHLQQAAKENALPRGVASLQRDLRLEKPPRRIECFDNSHFQGTEYVSSMVVFSDGRPKKSDYRKFKIHVEGNDDFAAMQEVVSRRYTRVLEEKTELPDLIMIDGGKGQLSAACAVLETLGLMGKIPVIGLAKRLEEIFLPNQSDAILLPKTSTSLRLLQAVRDEAHRFAITYHRLLRDKRTFQTELTSIMGIGEKTAQKLLITLGSVENIRNTAEADIAALTGEKAARAIKQYFETLAAEAMEE